MWCLRPKKCWCGIESIVKVLLSLLFLSLGGNAVAQPVLNNWYSFGRDQSALGSIYVTDSCYYATGHGKATDGSYWDAVFVKFDLDGGILEQKFLHQAGEGINTFGSSLCPTYDTNFITLADYGDNFLFIKYKPNGDTIFSELIDTFSLYHNLTATQPRSIIEIPEDSSYMCLALVNDELTVFGKTLIFRVSKFGEVLSYGAYGPDEPEFFGFYTGNFIREDDGFVISGNIIKTSGGPVNMRRHVRLVKTDLWGNELWRWTDWDNLLDAFPYGLTSTPDGGYLYGGVSGDHVFDITWSQFYKPHIVKLNADLSLDWEIEITDSNDINVVNCTDILVLDDGTYIATGYQDTDSMLVGWMINFNLSGQVIWDSYFSYVPFESAIYTPWHELWDIAQTEDEGFVMVGIAEDVQATFAGTPGRFGWLLKVDSVGCLVPGCQDFLDVDEEKPVVKLLLYPNPTSTTLNIYYNDPSFSGKAEMTVYDMNGVCVKLWKLFANDMAYIYDVSGLASGTYLIKVCNGDELMQSQKFIRH